MRSLQSFKAYLQARDYSPLTIKGYVGDARRFGQWLERQGKQDVSIQDLHAKAIKAYSGVQRRHRG